MGAMVVCAQPYKDATLSAEERARDLLGRLTLEEKGRLMVNFTAQLNHRLLDGSHVRDLLVRMEELMAPRRDS